MKESYPKHSIEPRDVPKDLKGKKTQTLWQGHRACSPSQVAEEPILGEEVGWHGSRASPLYAIASFSPLALHSPTPMSNSHSLEGLNLEPWKWAWWQDTFPWREENLRKQVQFEVEEELGAEPDLPTELVYFLAEGVPLLLRAPNTALPQQGEPDQRFQSQLPPVNPAHSPGKGQEGKDQTPLGTPTSGSLMSYLSPTALTSSGGEKWGWLLSSVLGCISYRGTKMNILPNTMPCGRWLPLGYHWHKRPLAGGTPYLPYPGFTHRTFVPLPPTHRTSGLFIRRICWL